ncbi:MAG: response regulator transcription factor [Terracidiphilus sp.]
MNILIADDHAAVRQGLREILADALPEAHFFEASNREEVLRCLAKTKYAVLLLDINMPGTSGLDLLREVKRIYSRLPVIIVSVQPEDQYGMRSLQAGAAAYINKDKAPEELALATMKFLHAGNFTKPRIEGQQNARLEWAIDRFDQRGKSSESSA